MAKLYFPVSIFALFLTSSHNLQSNPVILNFSPSANSGDAIYVQGSGFGVAPTVQYSFNDSNWKSFASVNASHDTVIVKIPPSERGMPNLVTIRVSADNITWSPVVYLNRAHAMSFDSPQVSAGAPFRVFGRNLYLGRLPTVRFYDMSDGSVYFANVNTALSTDYALQATAPEGIKAGHSYNVYVNNSYNGSGSSGGETLADQPLAGGAAGADFWNLGVGWAADLNFYSNVYNIQTDQRLVTHAYGAGSDSDIYTIGAAIWAAYQDGGGIVYLPAGTYNLIVGNGCGVTLLPRVAIMGDGPGQTIVNYGSGSAGSPYQGSVGVCFALSQSGVSDLTLNNANQPGNWSQPALSINGSEVFIQRVTWNMGSSMPVSLPATGRLAIENSSFTQTSDTRFICNATLDLSSISNFVIRRNYIQFVCGGLQLAKTENGVFENNNVVRDASVILPPGNVTHVIAASFVHDLTVLSNSFIVQGGTLPAANNGETINSEAGGANRQDEFRGTISSASSSSLSDAYQNFFYSSNINPSLQPGTAMVAIVSGTGTGQWRTVTGISGDGQTLSVDRPWDVIPSAGSNYATFDWSAFNWIIANNSMLSNPKGLEFFNASALDVLITGNTMTDNSGIMITPDQAPPSLFNLVSRTQILNNKILDTLGLRPAYVATVPREDGQLSSFGTSLLGVEVRGNDILASIPNTLVLDGELDDVKARAEAFNCYWLWQTIGTFQDVDIPGSLGVVFQANTAVNSNNVFELGSATYETALQDTLMRNAGNLENDVLIPNAPRASVATQVGGVWTYTPVNGISEPWNSVGTSWSVANGGAFSITPQPSYIGNSDLLSMVSQAVNGDVSEVARIALPSNADGAAMGLVMMRDTTLPSSAFASVGPIYGNQVAFSWRNAAGGAVQTAVVPNFAAVVWAKLVKSGDSFAAYQSGDGINWSLIGSAPVMFISAQYNVGIAALTNGSQPGMTIQFDKVDVEGSTVF